MNPIHISIQWESALPTVNKALCRWDIGGGEILTPLSLGKAGILGWQPQSLKSMAGAELLKNKNSLGAII